MTAPPYTKLAVDWHSLYLIQLDVFSTFSYFIFGTARTELSRTLRKPYCHSVSYQLIVLWLEVPRAAHGEGRVCEEQREIADAGGESLKVFDAKVSFFESKADLQRSWMWFVQNNAKIPVAEYINTKEKWEGFTFSGAPSQETFTLPSQTPEDRGEAATAPLPDSLYRLGLPTADPARSQHEASQDPGHPRVLPSQGLRAG